MSHELEMINDAVSHAYVGEVPWHGLGTKVEPNLTPEEMLKAANLDWTVEKCPDFTLINDTYAQNGNYSLVRNTDKKILSTVSEAWQPVQNHEAFEFFNDFINAGMLEMHTAGSLKGGTKVWALAKMKSSFEVVANDVIENYLLFTNPHEYGKSVDIRFTPIRVVCNNTLTMALNANVDKFVRLNHSKKFDATFAKTAIGMTENLISSYKEKAQFLASKNFNSEKVEEFMKEVFPANSNEETGRTASKVLNMIEEQPGNEFAKGSWWQAFNAVTYALDHVVGRSNDTRLSSSWYGVNKDKKNKALSLAVDYANAA